ncbi:MULTISPECIES: hypothetical protein [Acidithrix]|uniref:Hydrogenase 4 membrane subunit n=1 Tax=Acidithrix ferrooxidans TaxID=1280514 RepID=A0A0D8HGV4_9ACTN|nr:MULTISPECIES: hypothetical protein [Acidithrix]KJF17153.1 hydrogenase 4 membrane subunit [Acidithrix ferrooxidans]CAG4934639.1 unnamed protein product [Acidithrix sp. C25]
MSVGSFTSLFYFDIGAFLFFTMAIAWRKSLFGQVRLLRANAIALFLLGLLSGIYAKDAALIGLSIVILLVRAYGIPTIIARAIPHSGDQWESTRVVNTTASILIVAAITAFAYILTEPLVALNPTKRIASLPVGVSALLIAVFLIVTRRRIATQLIAFALFDNAISACAFVLTEGVPLVVESGALLDVLLLIFVLVALASNMRSQTQSMDIAELRELHE